MTNYLADHSYFTNKFDLDEAATAHKHDNWQAMNNTDRDVLDVIRRYSVKFGAAHLKHNTIAEAIGKSNATARRAIRKLVTLEIIDKTHYVRPVMSGLGANIYAIRPYEAPRKLVEEHPIKQVGEKVKETHSVEKQIKQPKGQNIEEMPAPTTLFERMKTMLASTNGKDAQANRFFGVYRQLSLPMLKFSIHAHKGKLFERLALQALHLAVQATKRKEIRNLPGYYAGILRELIGEALFNDAFMDYDMPVERLMNGV